jgi:hypothetical protein
MNRLTTTEQDVDLIGKHFSAQLSAYSPNLPHDISERLRVARHLALSQIKPALQARRVTHVQINSNGSLTGSPDEGLNFWSIVASILPLLVLVAGLMSIQWIQEENIASEIAAIDAALLTDELPPDAYTDAGFTQFLKRGLGGSITHD